MHWPRYYTILSLLFVCLLLPQFAYAQRYKAMMEDPQINVYEVIAEAEAYFESKGKGKGSGWKGFQRWRQDNESRYYPSGDRSQTDPYFVSKAYSAFLSENPPARNSMTSNWLDLGPYTIDQVTGHYSVGLGRVETFYVNPADDQNIYLGSRSGGFWKTSNGGATWTCTTDFLIASGVNTMDASPTNPDSVLINIRNGANGNSYGIYRSDDAGNSWVQSNFNPQNLNWGGLGDNAKIYKITYHPTVPNLVFIGTSKGLYRSTDDLATWTQLMSTTDITEIAFHPTDPDIMYVYDTYYWGPNQSVVLVSTDRGLTFTASSTLTNNSDAGLYLYTSPDCPDCVYAASSNGLWRSTNTGSSFTYIQNPGSSCVGGFAVSDLDEDNILYGYLDTEFSTDGGATFNQVTYWSTGNSNWNNTGQYVHADLREAECYNGVFYVATDGFLCKSTDNGNTWDILSEGTGIRENYNLGLSQSNHHRTVCGSQDNGTSIDTESNWIEFYGADGMEGFIHPLNPDWMLASLQNGGRRRTKDGGLSQSGVTPSGQNGSWIAPFFYRPNDPLTVYSLGENIYKSEDFGSTWTNIGTPNFTGTISHATIAENNCDIMVVSRGSSIEKSTNGGATFTNIKGTLPNYSITDIAFDPNNDDIIVVTYGRYQNDNSKVYISMDQGATWQNITYNLNDMPLLSVVVDHTDASTIYVGGEVGIYKKAMTETSWSLYNTNLPNMSVKEMEVMRGSNTLRAATWGRGLWESDLDGRSTFPKIMTTTITDPPTEDLPKTSTDQFVTSTITYTGNLTSVFVKWSINSPTLDNTITMSNLSGNIWESDSPFPDQPEDTKLYFKVFAVGSAGDTTETYPFMFTFRPFEYCDASGTTSGGNLYIQQVNVANVNNFSNNDNYTYYGDEIINLELGSSYNLLVDGNTGWSSNDYAVWIDYDRDANFEVSERVLWEIGAGSLANTSFTVPLTATTDEILIMRVRLSYWGENPSPCGTTLGEVEDYPVLIPASVVPIELLDFTARLVQNEVQLAWQTANEINNKHFLVQRSADGIAWEHILTVAGAGQSQTIQQYNAVDKTPLTGQSYYRLEQQDFDGSLSYSPVRTIWFGLGSGISIHPNPAFSQLTLTGAGLSEKELFFYNAMGSLVSVSLIEAKTERFVFDVSDLPRGIYFLSIKGKEGVETLKLILK